MSEEKCDCLIGIMNDYSQSDENELYLSDYESKLRERIASTNRYNDILKDSPITYSEISYLDKRKGFTKLFNYCPNCGSKLNYVELRKVFK